MKLWARAFYIHQFHDTSYDQQAAEGEALNTKFEWSKFASELILKRQCKRTLYDTQTTQQDKLTQLLKCYTFHFAENIFFISV